MGIFPEINGATGGGRRVRDLTKGFILAGNEVEMIVPIWKKPNTISEEKIDLKIVYLGSVSGGSVWTRIMFWHQIIQYVKLRNIEVILFYNTLIDSVLPACILRKNKRFVIAEFCDLMSSQISKQGFQILKKWVYRLNEWLLPKITNLNIVISDFLYQRVAKFAPNTPIMKVPVLVDFEVFSPSNQLKNEFKNTKIITYIGSFFHHEGVSFLIKAFAKIIKQYPDIQLVIAGEHLNLPFNEDLEALSETLEIYEKVTFKGFIPTDEIKQLLEESDIVVVPQTNDVFSRAGLPTKLAEYAAMGKAIVLTNVGDVAQYFVHQENAIFCEPESIEALYEAICLLIEDENLRKKLAQNSRQVAQQYFDIQHNGSVIMDKINAIKKRQKCY